MAPVIIVVIVTNVEPHSCDGEQDRFCIRVNSQDIQSSNDAVVDMEGTGSSMDVGFVAITEVGDTSGISDPVIEKMLELREND